jgi:hypothetical protein
MAFSDETVSDPRLGGSRYEKTVFGARHPSGNLTVPERC